MVTANGSVVIASEDENPDLFLGIRGAGSNFGVVTRFVIRLHPQRRTVYAGALCIRNRFLSLCSMLSRVGGLR